MVVNSKLDQHWSVSMEAMSAVSDSYLGHRNLMFTFGGGASCDGAILMLTSLSGLQEADIKAYNQAVLLTLVKEGIRWHSTVRQATREVIKVVLELRGRSDHVSGNPEGDFIP